MNVYKLLSRLGVPGALIPVAGQYLYFLPETTDPDTQGVRYIVRALQVGLQKLGYSNIRLNGVFDEQTARAIDSLSPPQSSWRGKTWLQILGDVDSAMQNPAAQQVRLKALSGYHEVAGYYPAEGLWDDIVNKISPTPASQSSVLKWAKSGSNCSGADDATRKFFAGLQRQINRLLPVYGGGQIAEDGVIGGGTVGALSKLSAVTQMSLADCQAVAQNAVTIGSRLALAAAARGIAPDANKPVPVPLFKPAPTLPVSYGTEAVSADVRNQVAVKSWTDYLPYAGLAFVAAGAAFFVFKRKGTRAPA